MLKGFLGSKNAFSFPLRCTRALLDSVFGWIPCIQYLCRSWGVGFIGFSLVFKGCIRSCFGGFLGCPLYTLCVLGGVLRSF